MDDERAAADAAGARAALLGGDDQVAAGEQDLQRAVGGDAHVRVAADTGARRVERHRADVLRVDVDPVGLGLRGRRAPRTIETCTLPRGPHLVTLCPNFLFLSPFCVKNFQLDPQKT